MGEPLLAIITILVVLVIYFGNKYRLHIAEQTLKEKISWCVNKQPQTLIKPLLELSTGNSHYSFPKSSKMQNIDTKYRILTHEEEFARIILAAFQKELIKNHLNNHYHIIPEHYNDRITAQEYFVLSLKEFLVRHECDDTIDGHKMRTRTIDRQDYGYWGGPLYSATYELSDFAIAYLKMLYITEEYDLAMRNLKEKDTMYHEGIEQIKKSIDTRTLPVERF